MHNMILILLNLLRLLYSLICDPSRECSMCQWKEYVSSAVKLSVLWVVFMLIWSVVQFYLEVSLLIFLVWMIYLLMKVEYWSLLPSLFLSLSLPLHLIMLAPNTPASGACLLTIVIPNCWSDPFIITCSFSSSLYCFILNSALSYVSIATPACFGFYLPGFSFVFLLSVCVCVYWWSEFLQVNLSLGLIF